MNAQQLRNAMALARIGQTVAPDDLDVFNGFALPDYQPVTVTTRHIAGLLRWQCFQFNGGIDVHALDEIRRFGRRRFIVVDNESAGEA